MDCYNVTLNSLVKGKINKRSKVQKIDKMPLVEWLLTVRWSLIKIMLHLENYSLQNISK